MGASFPDHQRNGLRCVPQFVRRRRLDLLGRQMLFTLENSVQLRSGIAKLARFFGNAIGVNACEAQRGK
ncbi:hypothetical protein VXQ18_09805 [Brucella abortus]|nr:hypothetical protein [Brucella abortus]